MSVLRRFRFDDHARFQTTTVRLTFGGAAGALAALAARWAFGSEGAGAYSLIMGCMALGVATALLWGLHPLRLALRAPFWGFSAVLLLLAAGERHETFGLALMGGLLGWLASRGLGRGRRALVVGGGALGTILGIASARALETTILTAIDAPDIASYGLQGGVVGLFLALGTLPRHLGLRPDALGDDLATATRELPRDFAELVGRVHESRTRVLDALERRTDGGASERLKVRNAVDELSSAIIKVGRRWHAVDSDLGATHPSALQGRVEELQALIEKATDEEARRAYEKAHQALEDQMDHHREIVRSRERTVARLHSYLAVLERLHLAVIRFRSSDAHRFSGEMQPLLDELDGVGTDAELAAQALEAVH